MIDGLLEMVTRLDLLQCRRLLKIIAKANLEQYPLTATDLEGLLLNALEE